MLAKTNSFRMRYKFINQTLDVCKSNTIVLKIMIISNFFLIYIKKKQNTADIEILASTQAIIDKRRLDVSIKKEILKQDMNYTISKHKTNGYLYKKDHNDQDIKKVRR